MATLRPIWRFFQVGGLCQGFEPPLDLAARLQRRGGAGVDPADGAQNHPRLVARQFTHVRRDDPALRVGENSKRQADHFHSEGGRRVERLLLPDQERIVDLHFLRVSQDFVPVVDRDAHDLEAVGRVVALQLRQERDLAPTRCAPGRPEIHDQRPALPMIEAARHAVAVGQKHRRQGRREHEGRRLGCRCGCGRCRCTRPG
jgi:hypothetical protein